MPNTVEQEWKPRKRYLVRPSMQLKLVSKIVFGAMLLCLGLGLLAYLSITGGDDPYFFDPDAREAYENQLTILIVALAATITLGCSAVYVFGIVVTRKIAGPLIPIEKFIEQLEQGNYAIEDIKLRKGDEWLECVEKLNRLKNSLKEKFGEEDKILKKEDDH